MKKIAVVLCGSGYLDGSEIRESVGVLWALSQHTQDNAVQVQCFAPDLPQPEVVNGLTGQTALGEVRNMRVEAARISRGDVLPLSELNRTDALNSYSGVIIPGGYGAAKNLCTFATRGAQATVLPDLQAVLAGMFSLQKPIGAVCIAPAIVALALRGKGLELTVGQAGETSQELEKLGHRHIIKEAHECHVDLHHRVVTTPAYMYSNAPLHRIFEGIQKLVQEVVKLS